MLEHGLEIVAYALKYRKNREYRLHSASTGLLYQQIIDSKLLDWLSSCAELWSMFPYFVAGQMELAGFFGELVTKADQASVSQS